MGHLDLEQAAAARFRVDRQGTAPGVDLFAHRGQTDAAALALVDTPRSKICSRTSGWMPPPLSCTCSESSASS